MGNQSLVAINAALIQSIQEKDVYFRIRMKLRPDKHREYYPSIPIPKETAEPQKERVVPTHFEYGEDPYKDIREGFGNINYCLMFGEC